MIGKAMLPIGILLLYRQCFEQNREAHAPVGMDLTVALGNLHLGQHMTGNVEFGVG